MNMKRSPLTTSTDATLQQVFTKCSVVPSAPSMPTHTAPFYHQHGITAHVEELTVRFMSLLLGYSHAFSKAERPKDKLFLDIDHIIPFLYKYRHDILDVGRHKIPILGLEYEFFKSPLVQVVFKASTRVPQQPVLIIKGKWKGMDHPPSQHEDVPLDVITVITQLYSLWEESQVDTQAAHDLNVYIIKLISPTRYDQDYLRDTMKISIEAIENTINFWNTCDRQIQAFVTLLNKYDTTVVGDPLTVIPTPAVVQQQEMVLSTNDAEVPIEIM